MTVTSEDTGQHAPELPGEAGTASQASAGSASSSKGTIRRLSRLRGRLAVLALAAIATLGAAGTIGFGAAWASLNSRDASAGAARSAASGFLVALTNFDAKTVDADFNAVEAFATGAFATQAHRFFGSSIRGELAHADASSRGKVTSLYVQSIHGANASIYGIVDQTYANDVMKAPASDILRIVLSMRDTSAGWRVAGVDVLGSGSSSSLAP